MSLPMPCEACEGQGWLIFTVDDGTHVVQRCDACESYKSDFDARVAARQAGLKVRPLGVVSVTETKRWMDLYPNRGIQQKGS